MKLARYETHSSSNRKVANNVAHTNTSIQEWKRKRERVKMKVVGKRKRRFSVKNHRFGSKFSGFKIVWFGKQLTTIPQSKCISRR